MMHPRDAKGRFVRRTAAAACHLSRQARRAAGQPAAAATRLRQPLNSGHRRQSYRPPYLESLSEDELERLRLAQPGRCGWLGVQQHRDGAGNGGSRHD
jgi:hypothetical protein